jgi:hypothetical protein
MEWKPIETAPKDGSLLLLKAPTGKSAVGKWMAKPIFWDEAVRSDGSKCVFKRETGVYEGFFTAGLERPFAPVAWQSLPE